MIVQLFQQGKKSDGDRSNQIFYGGCEKECKYKKKKKKKKKKQ